MIVAAILAAWLQYGADGAPHVRAVVTDACPSVVADERTLRMTARAGKTAAFGDLVCDVEVPRESKTIRAGDRALPVPARDPKTIVVLGDTGCRIGAVTGQACDDPAAWPFPRSAQAIAAVHPDLIVHVGDYLYREHACPPTVRCGDSPHGDGSAAWNADWFAPAAPMLASAPLLLVRGNHEECARNGTGWFRYLEPHATAACTDATEPYAVDFGTLRIVAFDSAVAEDHRTNPARVPVYRKQFAEVRKLAKGPSWFVTHRPPYLNDDERSTMGDALAPFSAVLSGHLHLFAALNVEALPPLLVNGEGGARLDPDYTPLLGFGVGDLHLDGKTFGSAHFGFAVYTRENAGWSISLRDPDGAERARCRLAGRSVTCALRPPPG